MRLNITPVVGFSASRFHARGRQRLILWCHASASTLMQDTFCFICCELGRRWRTYTVATPVEIRNAVLPQRRTKGTDNRSTFALFSCVAPTGNMLASRLINNGTFRRMCANSPLLYIVGKTRASLSTLGSNVRMIL